MIYADLLARVSVIAQVPLLGRWADVGGWSSGHHITTRRRVGLPEPITFNLRRSSLNKPTVVASALSLPVRSGAFDTAVMVDVLEHIPTSERQLAIVELARVASQWLIVCPIATPQNVAMERALLATVSAAGEVMPGLAEHQTFGLPPTEDVCRLVSRAGMIQQLCYVTPRRHLIESVVSQLSAPDCERSDIADQHSARAAESGSVRREHAYRISILARSVHS